MIYLMPAEAWDQLMSGFKGWLKEKNVLDPGRKTFDAYTWNAFHLQDFPWCNVHGSETCMETIKCDGRPPAVFLIVNSLIALRRVSFVSAPTTELTLLVRDLYYIDED